MLKNSLNAICALMYCPEDQKFETFMESLEEVQDRIQLRYAWPEGPFNLEPFDWYAFWNVSLNLRPSRQVPTAPSATLMVRTDGDRWKSLVVTRFLQWVSTQLPTASIRVNDGGSYLRPGGIVIENGRCRADGGSVSAWSYYFVETEGWWSTASVFEASDPFYKSLLFAPLSAAHFAERADISALGLSSEELERLTIDEVADRIRFPWDEDKT